MLVWIVGLSGSGKTTIGKHLYQSIKSGASNTVFIDGDEIRAVFAHDRNNDAYSVSERRKNAERIVSLCRWLDSQQINVVCCILSAFRDITDTNRFIFNPYFEVFVDVPISKLITRDNKGLYQSALAGQRQNVVGVDIPYDPPTTPDIVINNTFNPDDVAKYVSTIINAMKGKDDALPLHR